MRKFIFDKDIVVTIFAVVVLSFVLTADFSAVLASDGCPDPGLSIVPNANMDPETVWLHVEASEFVRCFRESLPPDEPYIVQYWYEFDDGQTSGITSKSYTSAEHDRDSVSHFYDGPDARLYNPKAHVIFFPEVPFSHEHTVTAKLTLAPANMFVYESQIRSTDGGAPYVKGQSRNFEAVFNWRAASWAQYKIDLKKGGTVVQTTGWGDLTNYFTQLDSDPLSGHATAEEKEAKSFTFDSAGVYQVCASGEAQSGGDGYAEDLDNCISITVESPLRFLDLAQVGATSNSITWSWSQDSDPSSRYEVLEGEFVKINTASTFGTETGLGMPNENYTRTVVAVDSADVVVAKDSDGFTGFTAPATPTPKNPQPTGVGSEHTNNQLIVKWDKGTQGTARSVIYKVYDDESGVYLGEVADGSSVTVGASGCKFLKIVANNGYSSWTDRFSLCTNRPPAL